MNGDSQGVEGNQECFCGGEYDHFEYHHPDGCARKPLADDLAELQEDSHAE